MSRDTGPWLYCLTHQLPEDQATPLGLFCPACKERLYTAPPRGRLGAFWESQPGAHAPDGQPLWVFSLMWDDFRVRALHPPGSTEDPRAAKAREYERLRLEHEALHGSFHETLVPLEEDFSHLSVSFGEATPSDEAPPGDDFEALASAEGGEEAEPEEERWLDIPEPESWLDIEWEPDDEG